MLRNAPSTFLRTSTTRRGRVGITGQVGVGPARPLNRLMARPKHGTARVLEWNARRKPCREAGHRTLWPGPASGRLACAVRTECAPAAGGGKEPCMPFLPCCSLLAGSWDETVAQLCTHRSSIPSRQYGSARITGLLADSMRNAAPMRPCGKGRRGAHFFCRAGPTGALPGADSQAGPRRRPASVNRRKRTVHARRGGHGACRAADSDAGNPGLPRECQAPGSSAAHRLSQSAANGSAHLRRVFFDILRFRDARTGSLNHLSFLFDLRHLVFLFHFCTIYQITSPSRLQTPRFCQMVLAFQFQFFDARSFCSSRL